MKWIVCTVLAAATIGSPRLAAQQRGRGAAPPAPRAPARPPTPAPAPPPPQISVAGLRIVGVGLGANGSEVHAFNDRPGMAVALAIQAPAGSGIVQIDERGSRVDACTDDKGQNLLEEGRFGSFPKVTEDHAAAMVDIEMRGRPSAGAASVNLQGSVAMTLASGSTPTRIPNVRLEPARTMKLGTATITVKSATVGDDSTDITLALSRLVLNTIQTVRFFDAKGETIESRRSGSGYMNDAAEVEFGLKTKEKVVAVEFLVWQNLRQIKAPFNVTVGLSLGGDSRPATTADTAPSTATPAATPRSNEGRGGPPLIAPGPNDGASSVDAVVKQMQSAGTAGKGRELLAVIYPDDRAKFGQIVATIVTFSVMAHLNDEKAADKAQKDVDTLFAKHKLKLPLNREPADIFKETDLAAFVTDGLGYLKTQMTKGQDPMEALPVPKGRPQNVTVDGDAATAKLGDSDAKFTRVNSKWFIRVSE